MTIPNKPNSLEISPQSTSSNIPNKFEYVMGSIGQVASEVTKLTDNMNTLVEAVTISHQKSVEASEISQQQLLGMVANIITTEAIRAEEIRKSESLRAEEIRKSEAASLRAELKAEFSLVKQELAEIKRGVIMVLGRPISDFDGVSLETKEVLEEALTFTDEEVIEIKDFTMNRNGKKPSKTQKDNGLVVETVKSFKATRGKENPPSHGEKTAFGNWANSVLGKAFGTEMQSWLHPKLQDSVDYLAHYYHHERLNERKY